MITTSIGTSIRGEIKEIFDKRGVVVSIKRIAQILAEDRWRSCRLHTRSRSRGIREERKTVSQMFLSLIGWRRWGVEVCAEGWRPWKRTILWPIRRLWPYERRFGSFWLDIQKVIGWREGRRASFLDSFVAFLLCRWHKPMPVHDSLDQNGFLTPNQDGLLTRSAISITMLWSIKMLVTKGLSQFV